MLFFFFKKVRVRVSFTLLCCFMGIGLTQVGLAQTTQLQAVEFEDPITGKSALAVGSCHIASLGAVLKKLPPQVREELLNTRYLVVEKANDFPTYPVYLSKHVQNWWIHLRKTKSELSKELRFY